ncbi:MAG: phenylalanine--tRNA ligase beta subunit-related protein, partial [Candidatus Omnitrophota bacterium]
MKLTYNWLKDFLEIKITPGVLADKLTMAGLEVKSVEERDGDFVFEVEITSNRPDWLSIVGVAREVAAITNTKRKTQSVKPQSKIKNFKRTGNGFKIEIEDKKDCPIYSAKIIKNVIVGSSPDWLRKRLELIGCRSINNIVDIANYCLFTYGEPLHAFDLDRLVNGLAGEPVSRLGIIVRRARNKEELVTIDGMKRILNEDVLIIASDTNPHTRTPAHPLTGTPIAIAGVMGGKDTEVSFATKNILLESAIFNPLVIRRGRRKLGLQTDSSYRFERGVDFETIELATDEAVKLILDLAGGQLYLAKSEGLTKGKNKIISFDINSAARILGIDIPVIKIKNILNHLGFGVQPKG